MSKTNQRTAVVNTIMSVLQERDHNYKLGGEVSMKDTLTTADKVTIRSILFTAFRAGEIEYKETFQHKVDDDKELKSYVSSLLNNWVRKAIEFNAGIKHEAKNPGSRAGNSDPEIKEMKKLLLVTADPEAQAVIQATIDAKLAEIKASKQQVSVDYDQLPAELREKLGL